MKCKFRVSYFTDEGISEDNIPCKSMGSTVQNIYSMQQEFQAQCNSIGCRGVAIQETCRPLDITAMTKDTNPNLVLANSPKCSSRQFGGQCCVSVTCVSAKYDFTWFFRMTFKTLFTEANSLTSCIFPYVWAATNTVGYWMDLSQLAWPSMGES